MTSTRRSKLVKQLRENIEHQKATMPSETKIERVLHPEVWLCSVRGVTCMIRIAALRLSIGVRDDDIAFLTTEATLESKDNLGALRAKVEARIKVLMEDIQKMQDAGYRYGALASVCKNDISEIWVLSWVFPDLAPEFVRREKADIARIKGAARVILRGEPKK